jgi:hypothetical protein
MNLGKTLFAQVMDFLPWKTFHRMARRYEADRRVRTLSSAEQFRVMAFAQLTYRESLRDIETCLVLKQPSSITWAFPNRWRVRRWPMPTSDAIGGCSPSSRST